MKILIAAVLLLVSNAIAATASESWLTVNGRTNSGGQLLIDTNSSQVIKPDEEFHFQYRTISSTGVTATYQSWVNCRTTTWMAQTTKLLGRGKLKWVKVSVDSPAARNLVSTVCGMNILP